MAKYRYNSRGTTVTEQEVNGVTDTEVDNRSIPNAPGNRDWNDYVIWRDAGGVADPFMSLSEIKDAKKAELKQACHDDIISGFTSTVVIASDGNSPFDYESAPQDQRNLLGASSTTVDINFTVIDGGTKKRVLHTPAEIKAVYDEGVARIGNMKDDLYLYYADVDAAIDEAAVDAIVWVYPKP